MNLEDLKNKHDGERCFILGTGSSLNNTDLSLLKDEICFGVNVLYMGVEKFGIECKYYAVGDCGVWNNHYEGILNLDTICFVSEEISRTYPDTLNENCLVIKTLLSMWKYKMFSYDLTIGKFSGDNIIIDCLQEAFYLGFKTVYLVGCDWSFTGHFNDGRTHDTTKQFLETGDYKYSMNVAQRFAKSTASCEVCKRAYEANERKIYNATVGGCLNAFERAKLEDVIKK